MMANDISYTAFGRFTNTHLDVLLALNSSGKHNFSLIKSYNMSNSYSNVFHNVILLHVDDKSGQEVTSTTFNFPVQLDLNKLYSDAQLSLPIDESLDNLVLLVAHTDGDLTTDLLAINSQIPSFIANVYADGNYQDRYFGIGEGKDKLSGNKRPKVIGVSIIRK